MIRSQPRESKFEMDLAFRKGIPPPRFWRHMANRFRSLSAKYGDRLEATWSPVSVNAGGDLWVFSGATCKHELVRFKALAARAGAELGSTDRELAVFVWLDCLRAESSHRTLGPLVTHFDARGGSVTRQYEVVDELYQASAEYCLQLQSKEKATLRLSTHASGFEGKAG